MLMFKKENIFIIILVSLLVFLIIVSGVFVYKWQQIQKELVKQVEQNTNLTKQIDELQKEIEELKIIAGEVTIVTDKTEYKQGEIAEIIVKNNLDKSIWYLNAELCGWNPWLNLQRFEKGTWRKLEIQKPEDNGKCMICVREYTPIEALIFELKSSSELVDRWILKNCETVSVIGPKLTLKLIEPGIYRFSFNYGLTKNTYTEKITYSNEFIIK